jgi:hypothetical protein
MSFTHNPRNQCGNCDAEVGQSHAQNEFGVFLCAACAGGSPQTSTGDLGDRIMALDRRGRPIATGPRDMGDALFAALDADTARIRPEPKQQSREESLAELSKFENSKDLGDQIVAAELRQRLAINP